MTASRVFRGYFHQVKATNGGRQRALLVTVGPDEAAALDTHLGPDPHRAKSIPITFVVGEAGDALAAIGADLAAGPAAHPPLTVTSIEISADVAAEILGELRALRAEVCAYRSELRGGEPRSVLAALAADIVDLHKRGIL